MSIFIPYTNQLYVQPSVTIASPTSPLSPSFTNISDTSIIMHKSDLVVSPGLPFTKMVMTTPRLVMYEDLNKDPKAIKMVVNYFHKGIFQEWINNKMKEVYDAIGGNLIKLRDVVTKEFVFDHLADYVSDKNKNWYDLPNDDEGAIKYLTKIILNELKK